MKGCNVYKSMLNIVLILLMLFHCSEAWAGDPVLDALGELFRPLAEFSLADIFGPVVTPLAERELADVVSQDPEFRRIDEHMRFGDRATLSRQRDCSNSNFMRHWIEYFKQGVPLRQAYSDYDNIVNNFMPSYAVALDTASRSCNVEWFNNALLAWNRHVVDALSRILHRNLEMYDCLAEMHLEYENAMRQGLGAPPSHLQRIDEFRELASGGWNVYKGIPDTRAYIFRRIALYTAVAGTISDWAKVPGAVAEASDVRDAAVRALAYLKAKKFYEDQVLPFISDTYMIALRTREESKERFSADYCFTCQCLKEDDHPVHPPAGTNPPSCSRSSGDVTSPPASPAAGR